MKIKVEFDITPIEARKLLGLPDVEAMQEKVIDLIFEDMQKGIQGIKDPDKLLQRFMPMGAPGMDQLQKMMPSILSKWASGDSDEKK